jgi:5S rRNA maturation endonuclease (ribonuclease M5)
MDYKKSLEDLEVIILDLIEENKSIPIIVEGDKDIEALRRLGFIGSIISVNMGINLSTFCDRISNDFDSIIILTDWDRRGGHLCHTIKKNLEGRVKCNIKYRELLAKNTTIRTVEGLPSWISTIKEKIGKI